MKIRRITVGGSVGTSQFIGGIELGDGLQIIHGPNRAGKSTLFAAVAWCLGAEHIFGVRAGNNAFFAESLRSQLVLDGSEKAPVTESYAEIEIERSEGDRLILHREILGDTRKVRVDHQNQRFYLQTGNNSLTDETTGFQNFLRRWTGIPLGELLFNTRGTESPIYFENLAPLFMIEQTSGWSDIQSEQTFTYGTIGIVEGSFELLLGLAESLKSRFAKQAQSRRLESIRLDAKRIAELVSSICVAEGWDISLSPAGSISEVIKRWSDFDVFHVLRNQCGLDVKAILESSRRRVNDIQFLLHNAGTAEGGLSSPTNASSEVISLRSELHKVSEQINSLKEQMEEQRSLLRVVEQQSESTSDLIRFRKLGVGRLPTAQCPTCGQLAEPSAFGLAEQSETELTTAEAQLLRQREMLRHTVVQIQKQIQRSLAVGQRLRKRLTDAEETLQLVNRAAGSTKENIVLWTGKLLEAQRQADRFAGVVAALEDAQRQIRGWLTDASSSLTTAVPQGEDSRLMDSFLRALSTHLFEVGCAGLSKSQADKVTLDDRYQPTLDGRLLKSIGSASDRARMVLAYVMALADVGINHPGFVLLDEPFQQNPDSVHRDLLLKYLSALPGKLQFQLIIFTSLLRSEFAKVARSGAQFTAVDKFLIHELRGLPDDTDDSESLYSDTQTNSPWEEETRRAVESALRSAVFVSPGQDDEIGYVLIGSAGDPGLTREGDLWRCDDPYQLHRVLTDIAESEWSKVAIVDDSESALESPADTIAREAIERFRAQLEQIGWRLSDEQYPG